MQIALIASVQRTPTKSKNDFGIGNGSQLLHHLRDDMKKFVSLTKGRPVIMGRNTWESLPEKNRPLPGRTNIIVSTTMEDLNIPNVYVVRSFDEALQTAATAPANAEVFVIGGAYLYAEALPKADTIYLTTVEGDKEATVFFPEIDYSENSQDWKVVETEFNTDETTQVPWTFRKLVRQ